MSRFLVIGFEFCEAFHYSLVLCKPKSEGTEYRVTVMNGDIEKQLDSDRTIREVNGSLQVEPSGNQVHNQVIRKIAHSLGRMIGKPVWEVKPL